VYLFRDCKRAATTAVFLTLTIMGCATASRQAHAQQSSEAMTRMREAYAECHRRYHPVKQAIARAVCENRSVGVLRPTMRDPDLMDQELAYNLVLAEKVQQGRMTPIEKEAAAAQYHSQIMTEGERRILARRAATAQPSAAESRQGQSVTIDPPMLQSDAPPLQNMQPPLTRCQTMRVGIMMQTVCH
jgi:hypothetical protein